MKLSRFQLFCLLPYFLVVKSGSDSSNAKRYSIGVSVTGPRSWPLYTDGPCHSRCGTLKNLTAKRPRVSSIGKKCAALHRQLWRLHMSEEFSSRTIHSKQTIQKKALAIYILFACVNVHIKFNEIPTINKMMFPKHKLFFSDC